MIYLGELGPPDTGSVARFGRHFLVLCLHQPGTDLALVVGDQGLPHPRTFTRSSSVLVPNFSSWRSDSKHSNLKRGPSLRQVSAR